MMHRQRRGRASSQPWRNIVVTVAVHRHDRGRASSRPWRNIVATVAVHRHGGSTGALLEWHRCAAGVAQVCYWSGTGVLLMHDNLSVLSFCYTCCCGVGGAGFLPLRNMQIFSCVPVSAVQFRRRNAVFLLEVLGELLGGEADAVGHLRDDLAALLQQLAAPLHADGAHEMDGREARDGYQLLIDAAAAHAHLVALLCPQFATLLQQFLLAPPVEDNVWYPGDQYVDVVGRDNYYALQYPLMKEYKKLSELYPNKFITLAECGNGDEVQISPLGKIWDEGSRWSWYMTWYDYNYNAGNSDDHQFAGEQWWQEAFSHDYVVTREEKKNLLNK